MPMVNSKPDAELLADLDATVAWAKAQGGNTDKLGIMGYCRGGRTVWVYSAHNAGLKAGVAFYGSLVDPEANKGIWPKSPIELAAQVKEPVLGLYGEADQGIPVAQVEQMKAALAGAEQDHRIQDLSRRAARLPRRLPAELPQGSRRRRVDADAGLVQEIRRAELIKASAKSPPRTRIRGGR